MGTTLKELNESILSSNEDKIGTCLKKIIEEKNLKLTDPDPFVKLLKTDRCNVWNLTFQCLAELAKNEENRKILTSEILIDNMIRICGQLKRDAVHQFFRAMGNIVYENDRCRELIGVNGIKVVYDKVKLISQDWSSFDSDPALLTSLFGCLLNIIVSNDDFQKVLLNNNILEIAEKILSKALENFEKYNDGILHLIHIVSFVTDHMADEWINLSFCVLLAKILKVSTNPEVSVLCLGILRQQSENDDLKLCLAENGTCEIIYEQTQKYITLVDNEESRAALKLACDMIVLILTGDEAMNYLYNNGKGRVYQQMIEWMDSSDADLVSTAILAIGNFARNDAHSISMVESGLFKKLINLLNRHNSAGADIKVQHALLSTLRHLSIPPQNKKKLIDENIIEIMYPLINVDTSQVAFKLMGTFRMLVDGQEETAKKLIDREEFLEKIAFWCYNSDHLGVRAEAPRLLAWLIKNSRSPESYRKVISVPDCVKCLVDMLLSQYGVMQNEALLSLILLCASCITANSKGLGSDKVNEKMENLNLCDGSDIFIDSGIDTNLRFMIKKYHKKFTFEIISNILQLYDCLLKSPSTADHLNKSETKEVLKLLVENNEIGELKTKTNSIVQSLSSLK